MEVPKVWEHCFFARFWIFGGAAFQDFFFFFWPVPISYIFLAYPSSGTKKIKKELMKSEHAGRNGGGRNGGGRARVF